VVTSMLTIYDHPADHPGHFVVRRSTVTPTTGMVWDPSVVLADTLEAARATVPDGWRRLPRQPEDDPVIVETWF
jgi:hypothetical protein